MIDFVADAIALLIIIAFCFRNTSCPYQEGKRGFPLRHSSVNQFQHGLLADDGESFGMRFIRSAINLARSEPLSSNLSNGWVESSAPNSTASLYESFWSCVLKNMTSTHPTAVEHPPLSELPCATSTSAKSSVSGKDTSSAAESVKPDTPADAASPYRIILVFDEAHVLVNNLRLAAPKISLFRVLRRSLWAIKDELERENVLVVFMDTTSQVSTFTPPDEQDDSARPTAAGPNLDDLPRLIYPPFSAIGSRPSDFTRRAEIVSNSLQITSVVSETGGAAASASVSSPVVPDDELLAMLRGRPLWRAYFNAFLARRNLLGGTRELFLSESLHALVCFAQSKLLGGRSQFISTDSTLMYSASASVGCCLLNLVPNPGKRLSATLVHSHMVRAKR